MNSPLEQIQSLEDAICQLRKIDSKLDAGQIIRAFREINKVLALFEQSKRTLITQSKDNISVATLEQVQDLEEVIRQLHKIGSLIYVGQIVAASGFVNRLITLLKKKLGSITPKKTDMVIIEDKTNEK